MIKHKDKILAALGDEELLMSELCARLGMTSDQLNNNVGKMIAEGLITKRGSGINYKGRPTKAQWQRQLYRRADVRLEDDTGRCVGAGVFGEGLWTVWKSSK